MVVNNFFFVSHNFPYVGTAVRNFIETYEFVFTQKYNQKNNYRMVKSKPSYCRSVILERGLTLSLRNFLHRVRQEQLKLNFLPTNSAV
jgi:hypothetical protein